jgi:hypothetical protein
MEEGKPDKVMMVEDKSDFTFKDIRFNYSLQSQCSKVPRLVLNRRSKKLQQLIEEGEYFAEEYIKMRDPILYYVYVGKFVRHGKDLAPKDLQLSEMLFNQVDNMEWEKVLIQALKNTKYAIDIDPMEQEEIPVEELEDNEDELIRLMHERFLAGLDDKFIDYKEIDDNPDFDDEKILNQDREDAYFEAEEPVLPDEAIHKYTGEQDY